MNPRTHDLIAVAFVVAGWTARSSIYVLVSFAFLFSLYAVWVSHRALNLVKPIADRQEASSKRVEQKTKSLLGEEPESATDA